MCSPARHTCCTVNNRHNGVHGFTTSSESRYSEGKKKSSIRLWLFYGYICLSLTLIIILPCYTQQCTCEFGCVCLCVCVPGPSGFLGHTRLRRHLMVKKLHLWPLTSPWTINRNRKHELILNWGLVLQFTPQRFRRDVGQSGGAACAVTHHNLCEVL